MKPMDLAPLLLQSILAGTGCALAVRRGRFVLGLYLGFVSLATVAGIPAVIYFQPELYRLGFFAVEAIHNVLLLLLAVETIAQLAARRSVLAWSIFWCTLLMVGAARQTADIGNMALLNVTAALDFCAMGILLLPLLRSDTRWTRQHALTAAGVAVVALGSVLPEITLLQSHPTIKALFVWADLPGLLLLTMAAAHKKISTPA